MAKDFMGLIVGFFIVAILLAVLVPVVVTTGLGSFDDSGQCANAGGFWNTSQGVCFTDSDELPGNITGYSAFPLKTLMIGSGVLGILLIIATFMVIKNTAFKIGR